MDGWNDNNWMNHGGWMEHAGYGMGWGGWISVVVAIGVIALVITVIVVAVRYLTGAQPQRSSTTLGHRRRRLPSRPAITWTSAKSTSSMRQDGA